MEKIQHLLDNLKSESSGIRSQATGKLWEIWYQEAGEAAESELHRGEELISDNRLNEAEQVFVDLIRNYPAFAEAHNKLATLLFLKRQYEDSVVECEQTLKMNPHHFGAWNGMGMCLYQLARYEEAIKSFEMACRIQPYADVNRGYIGRCRGKLN